MEAALVPTYQTAKVSISADHNWNSPPWEC